MRPSQPKHEPPPRLLPGPAPDERCSAEWCSGQRRTGIHLCAGCWNLLTPDERLAYMTACHAPWWPEMFTADPGDCLVDGVPCKVTEHGYPIAQPLGLDATYVQPLGVLLFELERRLGLQQVLACLTYRERMVRGRAAWRAAQRAETEALEGDPKERAVGRRLM